MSDITIRPVIPEDAADILAIYSYYVEKTAITFELEVPSLSEFQARIAKTLTKPLDCIKVHIVAPTIKPLTLVFVIFCKNLSIPVKNPKLPFSTDIAYKNIQTP